MGKMKNSKSGFVNAPGRVHAPAIFEMDICRVRDLIYGMWIIHPISRIRCQVRQVKDGYRCFGYIRQTTWGMYTYEDQKDKHVIRLPARSMQFCQIINIPLCFRKSASYY